MKSYRVSCDIVSGTLSAIVKADSIEEAEEKFDNLSADKYNEESDRRLENFKFDNICEICSQVEDADGRCGCTNKDAL